MADTMQIDLVSPERKLASLEGIEVRIPGAEGDLTVMAGHASLITTMRPGVLTIVGPSSADEYVVTGGFAEISPAGVSVLAERALHRDEMTQEIIDKMIEEAAHAHKNAHPDVADAAAKLVSDMVAMGTHIGLDPNQPSL